MTGHATKTLDDVFTALANDKRRQMVYKLSLHPTSVRELAEQQKLTLAAIHRHIRVLEQARLVQRKKRGRTNFLALDRKGLLLLQDWSNQYNPSWGNNKETLDNYIAKIKERSE